jgi:hypothetical protein
MPLYTTIAEHDGGTYVSQIQAEDRNAALRYWIEDSNPDSASSYIHNNKRKHKAKLASQLMDPDFGIYSLTGCVNVWQCLFRIRKMDGSFHIIRTDGEAEQFVDDNPS